MKKQRANEPNIDAGIDLYIYGPFHRYERKEVGNVRIGTEDLKPWYPVRDWMKDGWHLTPAELRRFARYFYERGKEAR